MEKCSIWVDEQFTRVRVNCSIASLSHKEQINGNNYLLLKKWEEAPFEVTIEIDGKLVYINCNCPLGINKKICLHKINAIRADREYGTDSTSESAIKRLKNLFGLHTTLRQHLEEKWRVSREYAVEHPDNEEEISKKRKILGEAFENGFIIDNALYDREPFDADAWAGNREIYADGLDCNVTLK